MRKSSAGFTYLFLLFAVAMVGIGLTVTAEVWSKLAFSWKRTEFLWVAEQYRTAIGSYYESSPGAAKMFPLQYTDLLQDLRSSSVRHHLRAPYRNPFAIDGQWEPIRGADGRIRGVRGLLDDGTQTTVEEFIYVPGEVSSSRPSAGAP